MAKTSITNLIKSFYENFSNYFSYLSPKSQESELLLKGLSAYETHIENLANSNKALSKQVLPALKAEILSGKTPPYEFNCTIVKTDINDFSTIFDNYPKEDFIAVIREYFYECAQIISKYKGYIYKFVGDEIIFYFKDDDHRNSKATAITAVLEITDFARKISQKHEKDLGYEFSVKSALSYGVVRLDALVDTFELFASNIIEASRMLSEISDQKDYTIVYSDEIKSDIDFFCESIKYKVASLKGINKDKQLYLYKAQTPLENILESISYDTVELLYYYRSYKDITFILKFLDISSDTLDENLYLLITNLMKRYSLTYTDREIKSAYEQLVKMLFKKYKSTNSKRYLYFLSSVIILSINLIDKSNFDKNLKSFMKKCLKLKDRRVVANTLDVFVHFDSGVEEDIFKSMLEYNDNRVLANALINEGIKELSKTVIHELKRMLKSKNDYFIASGLFSIGEIGKYYKIHNLVYYNTNIEFLNLVTSIKKYITHSNEMVRRQALLAVKKLNEEMLFKAIENIYNTTVSLQIKKSIDEYFYVQEKEVA